MYDSERLMFAVGALSDDKIEAAARALGYDGGKAAGRRKLGGRRALALALAAALLLSLGVAAYAVYSLGIRDMFRPLGALPEGADALIEQRQESGRGDGWSARITESLCDDATVMLTVTVDGGERYIVAPTDASPDDSLWVIGRESSQTLGEYAAAQGRTLLCVGAALPWEELGIASQGQRTVNLSDSEMQILLTASKTVSARSIDTVCTVYALAEGADTVQRVKIPFTMREGHSQELGIYKPLTPDAIPGVTLGALRVTRTPLGLNAEWPVTVTDEAAFQNILAVAFDEIADEHGGGMTLGEDGIWRGFFTMGQGDPGDTLTARFLDWDKQPLGTVVFEKVQ